MKGCVRMLMTKFSIVQGSNAKITQCGFCFECDNLDNNMRVNVGSTKLPITQSVTMFPCDN